MIKFIRYISFVFFGGTLSYVFGNHHEFFGIGESSAMWLSTISLLFFVIGIFGVMANYHWKGYWISVKKYGGDGF